MRIEVELDDFLKQYGGGRRIVVLQVPEDRITVRQIRELVGIPDALGTVAVNGSRSLLPDTVLEGAVVRLTFIPIPNGG